MKETAVFLSLLILAGCVSNYSDGNRAGVINKFSHKGLVCKSWEGEMLLGGFKTTTDADGKSAIGANVWSFYVPEGSLVEQVKHAMDSGKRVKLTYTQWAISPICQDSDYTVTKVEELQ